MNKVTTNAMVGLVLLLIFMALLLFLSAGTLHYWQAWIFLIVLGLLRMAANAYLMEYNPKLLERRISGGPTNENSPIQKIIQIMMTIGVTSILTVSALDYRFAWSWVSPYVFIVGDVLVIFGNLIIFFVFKQNSFASSTIELAPEQNVVSMGLYALVRHPMYMGNIIYLVGIPLALGSWWGLLVVALMVPVLMWRLIDEEQFLTKNLPGYSDYKNKIRYRLIPFVW